MDGFTRGLFIIMAFFVLFALAFVAARDFFLRDPEALAAAVQLLYEVILVLLPTTFGATVVFATFRKPTYVLFSARDVVKDHKLQFLMFVATCALVLAIVSQVAAIFAPREDEAVWQVVFHSFAFALLVTAGLIYLSVLCISILIYFSSETAELKLLNKLYYRMYQLDSHLKLLDCGDWRVVGTINFYLLGQLQKHSFKLAEVLNGLQPLAEVEFWDATNAAPLRDNWQLLIQLLQTAKLPGLFAVLWGVPLFFYSENIRQLLALAPDAALIVSLCVLLLFALLFQTYRPLRQITLFQTYGSWGYRFLDGSGRPCFYFSRRQTPRRCGARWLDALFNVLTLYRIELLNGYTQELPQTLLDTLSETDDERAAFLLKLACCLCGRLAREAGAALPARLTAALEDVREDPLFVSWSDAIWTDIKRDPGWYARRGAR